MHILIDARTPTLSQYRYLGDLLSQTIHSLRENTGGHRYSIFVSSQEHIPSREHPDFSFIVTSATCFSFAEQWSLANKIARIKPDYVYFLNSGPLLPRLRHTIYIPDLREYFYPSPDSGSFSRRRYTFVLKNLIQSAQRIIVPTLSVKKDILEIFTPQDEQITTIAPIYPYEFHLSEEEIRKSLSTLDIRRSFICTKSDWMPQHNLGRLIEGYALFAKNTPDAPELVIIGREDTRERNIRDIILSHGIQGAVRLVGALDQSTEAAVLKNSLAHVHTPLYDGWSAEIAEAVCHGKPILLSERGWARDISQSIGGSKTYWCNPLSVESIAAGYTALWKGAQEPSAPSFHPNVFDYAGMIRATPEKK